MFRILLYALVIYLVYQWIIRPLLKGFKGPSNDRPKVDQDPKTHSPKEDEYIDYEEIKE